MYVVLPIIRMSESEFLLTGQLIAVIVNTGILTASYTRKHSSFLIIRVSRFLTFCSCDLLQKYPWLLGTFACSLLALDSFLLFRW